MPAPSALTNNGHTQGLRAVTNIYAALWTKAVYVALFTLVTPYFVAVMERLILKEKLPPAFFTSLFGTLVGTVFILLGSLFEAQEEQGITPLDVLGMASALTSAFFLAGYMVLVRPSRTRAIGGRGAHVTPTRCG